MVPAIAGTVRPIVYCWRGLAVFNALRIAMPAAVLLAVVAACGGATPTTRPTSTSAQPTSTAARPSATAGEPTATAGAATPTSGGALTAAICRNLNDLSNTDYAFGKPF